MKHAMGWVLLGWIGLALSGALWATTPGLIAITPAQAEKELASMLAQDQAMRSNPATDPQVESDADERHRVRVFQLLAANLVKSPQAMYHAAWLLQHSPMTFCDKKLTSPCVENYLLAHELAKRAALLGYRPARHMAANCIDRYLWMLGKPQKYGTQYTSNEKGEMVTVPVDPATTDRERAEWDVQPLADYLAKKGV